MIIGLVNYPINIINSIIGISKSIIDSVSCIAGPFAPIFVMVIGGILGLIILKIVDFIIEMF
jgi:hypothetical protein